MKRCPTCLEEFADKFGFCPVDGAAMDGRAPSHEAALAEDGAAETAPHGAEYRLTILDDSGPARRIVRAVGKMAGRLKSPETQRPPGDDFREVLRYFRFYGKLSIFTCLETGALYLWVVIHSRFEEAIRFVPHSPGKVGIEVLLHVLLAANCVTVLLFACKHLRR